MANASSEADPRIYCLVGFMGAGKSSVGRVLADRLDWSFLDLDARIEETVGRTIPQIFQEQGESAFRRLEEKVGAEVLSGDRLVVATGGGWGAAPGRLAALPTEVRSIWLRVSPELAVIRTGRQAPGRPLLSDAEDPVAEAARLLEERSPHYRDAAVHIDTEDRDVDEVVDAILDTTRPRESSGLHG